MGQDLFFFPFLSFFFFLIGIFPDQGSSPCLLHWLAHSLPLSHQGSPRPVLKQDFPTTRAPVVPERSALPHTVDRRVHHSLALVDALSAPELAQELILSYACGFILGLGRITLYQAL